MNPRENYLALLNHEPTEWVPGLRISPDVAMLGARLEYWENGPLEGGLDYFGNGWIPTASAGGQPALDPDIIPLDDVCDWEDKVTFPNLDKIDWDAYAEKMLGLITSRDEQVVEYHTWNSVFLRFTHLLGFEDALCAFYEEPEASLALCNAIADYKIALLERVAKYLKPDAYVHYDDVATDRSLFMSPEVYREFIKPCHTRMNDAARALGMIPEIHVCGYCTDILEDLIEEGSQAWQSAQPVNDIPDIIERLGDRLSVIGGYDSNGKPGYPDVSDETIRADVDRCMDEYGKFGRAYGFFGFFLGTPGSPEIVHKYSVMYDQLCHRNNRS